MAPKITQVAQMMFKKIDTGASYYCSWNRSASKIAFGTLLVTILLDFYSILDRFLTRLSPKKLDLRTPLCSIFAWFLMDLTLNVKVCLWHFRCKFGPSLCTSCINQEQIQATKIFSRFRHTLPKGGGAFCPSILFLSFTALGNMLQQSRSANRN